MIPMKLTNLPEACSDIIDTEYIYLFESPKADVTAITALSTESHDFDLPC